MGGWGEGQTSDGPVCTGGREGGREGDLNAGLCPVILPRVVGMASPVVTIV